jgi:hypothetical protein
MRTSLFRTFEQLNCARAIWLIIRFCAGFSLCAGFSQNTAASTSSHASGSCFQIVKTAVAEPFYLTQRELAFRERFSFVRDPRQINERQAYLRHLLNIWLSNVQSSEISPAADKLLKIANQAGLSSEALWNLQKLKLLRL